jgi:CHASE1-domain containing sensor protein
MPKSLAAAGCEICSPAHSAHVLLTFGIWHLSNGDITSSAQERFDVRAAQIVTAVEQRIATIRAEGHANYSILPEKPERPVYHSLVYVELFVGRNLRAFGFDMYPNETRRESMDRAINYGLPSMSGMAKLAQETNQDVQHGFIYCLPVLSLGVSVKCATEQIWPSGPIKLGAWPV